MLFGSKAFTSVFFLSILVLGTAFGKHIPSKDSLFQIWNDPSQEDSQRLKAMDYLLAYHYVNGKLDSVVHYSDLLYKLALKDGNLLYQAKAQDRVGRAFLNIGIYSQSKPYYEKAVNLWQRVDSQKRVADVYNSLGIIFRRLGEFDSAKVYLEESINIHHKLGDSLNMRRALVSMAGLSEAQGKVLQSLQYNKKAIQLSQKAGDRRIEASARISLANNYKSLGDIPKAVEQYQASRALYKESDNPKGIINTLNNLSVLLIDNKEFENVEAYLDSAEILAEGTGLFRLRAITLANKAYLKTSQEDVQEGLSAFSKALDLAKKENITSMMPYLELEIGNLLIDMNRLDEAEEYLNNGRADSKRLGQEFEYLASDLYFSVLSSKKRDWASALRYAQEGYDRSEELQILDFQRDFAGELTNIYKQMGRDKEALKMFEVMVKFKDSLFNEENTRALINQEYRYAYQQEAYKDSLDNALIISQKEEENKRRERISYLLLGMLILTAIFGAILWNRFQLTQRQKGIIEVEKVKLDTSNAQLNQANAKLKELDDFKSRFFTNISHEFRTPLTVIGGMNRQIKNNPDRWFEKGNQIIDNNVRNLLNLINQILDLRKLESGGLQLSLIQDDVVKYLRSRTEAFQSLAESKDVELNFHSDLSELDMDFDPEKLLLIQSNLISNAVKFTPKGGKVDVNIGTDPSNNFLLEVKDTGIGISKDKIPFIFDRFYQVDGSQTREGEGTGIGLSLSKELVHLMEGSIVVESQPMKGTRFVVSLPISQRAIVQRQAPDKDSSFYKVNDWSSGAPTQNQITQEELPSLLIIEDNEDVASYLYACLEDSYKLMLARDGEEGVAVALEQVPDLIISDVMMPKKNGYEVCNELKSDERTSHIPVILLTAKADRDSRLEGLGKGADAYLTKPFDEEELFVRLEQLLTLRKKLQARYSGGTAELATPKPQFELEDAFIQKLKAKIIEHLDDSSYRPEDLCKDLGKSRTQMYNKLKALTGKSPSLFVRQIRLEKAKEFLKSTDMQVSEVAYAVGFSDPKYFTRIFTKEIGQSPKNWRAQ